MEIGFRVSQGFPTRCLKLLQERKYALEREAGKEGTLSFMLDP